MTSPPTEADLFRTFVRVMNVATRYRRGFGRLQGTAVRVETQSNLSLRMRYTSTSVSKPKLSNFVQSPFGHRIMNAAVGIATALAMWLTGVGEPILWGTVAFLLNYVPILGTALGVLIFLLAGLLTHDTLWQALLPAGLYFGFHLIEGETLTPMLLARRFTLNPVLVVISLVFWFWMWGIPGGILSMPMLAITKIICDRLQPLAAFGHFLEG